MSGVRCHIHLSSTSGFAFLYFTVQSTAVQYLYFKPRMSGRKWKCSSDVTGTSILFKVRYYRIENVLFSVCFLCIVCVKSFINLLKYSSMADCVSWASRLTFWTYEQIGTEISERNSFVCRRLTVTWSEHMFIEYCLCVATLAWWCIWAGFLYLVMTTAWSPACSHNMLGEG